jgi:hypothetical protein
VVPGSKEQFASSVHQAHEAPFHTPDRTEKPRGTMTDGHAAGHLQFERAGKPDIYFCIL